jgi:hypothetical protein
MNTSRLIGAVMRFLEVLVHFPPMIAECEPGA